MAKNDHKRMQQEVDRSYNDTVYGYGGSAGTPSTTTRSGHFNPGTPATTGVGGMTNLFSNLWGGSGTGGQTYDEIMNAYRGLVNGGGAGAGDFASARGGFQDLLNGGGVNQDAIRNRAMAETRSSYANATRNLNRQKSLQGGYSPGYTTALTRMARNQGQDAADASTNAEAGIQELISRNKIAGAGGLANIGEAENSFNLGALGGMSNFFGGSMDQLMKANSLQAQIAQMMMQGRAQTAQIPGNFQNAMGNIGSVLGLAGQVISPFAALAGNALRPQGGMWAGPTSGAGFGMPGTPPVGRNI